MGNTEYIEGLQQEIRECVAKLKELELKEELRDAEQDLEISEEDICGGQPATTGSGG